MKEAICTAVGIAGGFIARIFGGWDTGIATLCLFMALDYMTGLTVAAFFKKSTKTENGALKSTAGFKGLCKKGMILVFVLVAYRLDLVIGTTYIRDAVIIGFIANELISLTENAGLMGIPMPAPITKAIDILTKKAEVDENE